MNQVFWKFCKFASVGLCATAVHYSILMLLVEVFRIDAVFATTVGFVVAALVNYTLNRRFTFASNAKHIEALPKFFAVALIGAAINARVVGWVKGHTDVHYMVAQVCATGTLLAWNFTVNVIWTFKRVQ